MEPGVGGQIKGISLDSFLQMVQMERTTCTLQVTKGERSGRLFVLEGELIDAEHGQLPAFQAACHIISWSEPVIEIENRCERSENEIRQPLMHVLMEGLRLRDERREAAGAEASAPPEAQAETEGPSPAEPGAAASEGPVRTADRDVLAERRQRNKRRLVIAGAVVLAGVLAAAGVFLFQFYQARQAHRQMRAAFESAGTPQARLQVLDTYLSSVSDEAYRQEAEQLRRNTAEAWQRANFDRIHAKALAAEADGRIQDALAAYEGFLKQFGSGTAAAEARRRADALRTAMEESDYRALLADARTLGPMAVERYAAFLRDHPRSRHAEEIRQELTARRDAYHGALQAAIESCRRDEQWERCRELAGNYEAIYGDDNRSRDLERLQEEFTRKIAEQEMLDKLVALAEQAGDDHVAARRVFTDYLKAVPNTPLRAKIEERLAAVTQRETEDALRRLHAAVIESLRRAGDRFTVGPEEGVFKDRRSGLMWTLLDSVEAGDGCMSFSAASKYASALRVGGYRDWRLPTVDELAGLYKTAPFFPEGEAGWYWTSETYTRYVGMKRVTNVRIVTTRPETDWQAQSRDTIQCGAVRAVRR